MSTERSHELTRRLAREEGMLVGVSSGAALAACLDLAARIGEGVIVTVFPGQRDALSDRALLGRTGRDDAGVGNRVTTHDGGGARGDPRARRRRLSRTSAAAR